MTKPTPNPSALIVPRENIHPRTKQPRHDITEEMIAARRADLKENGQIHSLLVEEDPTRPGHFWINDGELRWRGSYHARDWSGLPEMRVEVEPPGTAEKAFVRAALANDGTIPLSDYDWCLSIAHMHEAFATPLTSINTRFKRGRNWAEDFWAIYNGADKMPKDLGAALLETLKQPENKNKAKLVAGAPNVRLQREMVRDFDSLTVETARARIAKWAEDHKPKAPAAASSSGSGTLRFGGGGSSPTKPKPQSRNRPVTSNAPDARKECSDALDVMAGRVKHLQAWWEHLTPAARRELKASAQDIAGALEDLEK